MPDFGRFALLGRMEFTVFRLLRGVRKTEGNAMIPYHLPFLELPDSPGALPGEVCNEGSGVE